eukprot:2865155-Pleurochrysis_carterae.AAC.1
MAARVWPCLLNSLPVTELDMENDEISDRLLSSGASRRVEDIHSHNLYDLFCLLLIITDHKIVDSYILVSMRTQFPMVLVKMTVKIGWSPAQACVAPEAETAGSILSAEDDDTGSESEPYCVPENAILSHLHKQPFFRLGGAQNLFDHRPCDIE